MNTSESKGLKRGSRVYWRGDANDGGIITNMSWDGHDRLGQWSGGHRAPSGHARDPASTNKASYYCVGL